jgi:hypothetical protein
MRALALLSLLIFLFASCLKDVHPLAGPNTNGIPIPAHIYKIGDKYLDQIIFYLDSTGQRGLIAPPINATNALPWIPGTQDYVHPISPTADIGSGVNNTDYIIGMFGLKDSGYAASICRFSYMLGINDAILPSKNELNEMYKNKNFIGGFENGGLYWSSTDCSDSSKAWAQDFGNGNQIQLNKRDTIHVRPIMSF